MESTKPSQAGIAIKWAVFNIIAAIIITFATQYIGADTMGPARYIGDIPFIIFMCLAQVEYRKQLSGFMTYGQSFVEGLLYSVFSGIMLAIFMYIYLGILNPHAMEQTIAAQHDKMVAQGLSSDQIDTASDISRKYGAIIAAVFIIFIVPIVGIVISLITSAIFKKERTIQDIENQQNDPAV